MVVEHGGSFECFLCIFYLLNFYLGRWCRRRWAACRCSRWQAPCWRCRWSVSPPSADSRRPDSRGCRRAGPSPPSPASAGQNTMKIQSISRFFFLPTLCVCVCVCVISRSSVCFSSKTKPTPNQRLSIVETVRIVHRRWRCSRFVVLPFPLSVSILPLKCPRNPMCKFGISSTIGFVPIKTKVYCANISSQPSWFVVD